MIILLFSPIGANTADTRLGKSFFHLWFSESYNAKKYLLLHYSFMSEVANLFFSDKLCFFTEIFPYKFTSSYINCSRERLPGYSVIIEH